MPLEQPAFDMTNVTSGITLDEFTIDQDDPTDVGEGQREYLRQVELPYDPEIHTLVDDVIKLGNPGDNLEAMFSADDESEHLLSLVEDWRTLSPDDPKGELINTRVTSPIVQKIDYLMSRTRHEVWRTRSDFFREAIWMYVRSVMNALQTQDPTLLTLMAEAELTGRAQFHNTRRNRLEKAITDMASYLTDLVNLDDHEEAFRVLQETAVRLRAIQVPAWRRQWLTTLNSLPILKVTARLLDMNGWDIPVEFYPAAGKSALVSIAKPPGGTVAPASPREKE